MNAGLLSILQKVRQFRDKYTVAIFKFNLIFKLPGGEIVASRIFGIFLLRCTKPDTFLPPGSKRGYLNSRNRSAGWVGNRVLLLLAPPEARIRHPTELLKKRGEGREGTAGKLFWG